jgi:hypothetical protein
MLGSALGDMMRANATRLQPELTDPSSEVAQDRQDSQVYLKAPRPPKKVGDPVLSESAEPPSNFVAFLGEQRGLDDDAAFALLCRLLSEYRTPVRREIALLQRSA